MWDFKNSIYCCSVAFLGCSGLSVEICDGSCRVSSAESSPQALVSRARKYSVCFFLFSFLCRTQQLHTAMWVSVTPLLPALRHKHTHTLAVTLVWARTHTHTGTGWPSSLGEGGYPFLFTAVSLSPAGGCHGNRAWLETTGEKERKKSGALPTSSPLLLCVSPPQKYSFSNMRCISKLITGFQWSWASWWPLCVSYNL